jgi:two-component system phosphate regulon response regulator PhoB
MSGRILIVEDDVAISKIIKDGLTFKGYTCTIKPNAEQALGQVAIAPPDLIVLDVNLGGLTGFDFCEMLKKNPKTASIPIIMLTAQGAVSSRIKGLELGADDYMTKPFAEGELVARVAALLRRARADGVPAAVLRGGGLELNLDAREASLDGKRLALSALEFDLLTLFLQKRDMVHTYASLAETVWGDQRTATSHTITVAVAKLRGKLGAAGKQIESVPGLGYKFVG